eukprot:1006445-Pelagomonas_calceolata.AAC.1
MQKALVWMFGPEGVVQLANLNTPPPPPPPPPPKVTPAADGSSFVEVVCEAVTGGSSYVGLGPANHSTLSPRYEAFSMWNAACKSIGPAVHGVRWVWLAKGMGGHG